MYGGNLVTWRSKKQDGVGRSSAEAELHALPHRICELLWKNLLMKLRVEVVALLKLYCNDKTEISISHNLVHHGKTKHKGIDSYFIKEKIEKEIMCIIYVSTREQTVNIVTNSLE